MGSTSAHGENSPDGLGRRDLIKRSAALGLIAVPTMSFLSACAAGGDESATKGGAPKGAVTKENPFGVAKGGKLDVVVFKGGFGDDYAKAWEAAFDKKWAPPAPTWAPRRSPPSSSRASTAATRRTSSTTPAPSRSSSTCSPRAASSPTSPCSSTPPRWTTRRRRSATP